MTEGIHIRLMGAIHADWGSKTLEIALPSESTGFTLKNLLETLSQRYHDKFWLYFDKDWLPKRGTIVLLNEADYQIAGGLNTKLRIGDQLVFVPTISGG